MLPLQQSPVEQQKGGKNDSESTDAVYLLVYAMLIFVVPRVSEIAEKC
jgi:hypothetical protein